MPAATLPDSAFLSALGTPAARMVPTTNGITGTTSYRRVGTKPVRKQSSRNPGADAGWKTSSDQERRRRNAHCHRVRSATSGAKALVEAPNAFIQAITRIMQDKQNHPVIAQMINPEADDDPTPLERAASSSGGHSAEAQ